MVSDMNLQERYNEYDNWAWLYNTTMGPEYCQNQLQPLEKMLLPHLSKNAEILDLCCGTGHLMKKLCERGYQITGFDGSEEMLEYARQNAPKAQIILGDARSFELPERFDAVFSTSASLNHILELEELKSVFQNVYSSLKQNGIFLFDINHQGQMEKWWKGRLVEGEIENHFAWELTPHYNKDDKLGYFKVTIYQAPTQKRYWPFALIQKQLKGLVYKLVSLRRLTRFRLKILNQFSSWEKDWKRSEIIYKVRGHSATEVKQILEEVGFTDVEVRTIEGNLQLDNNHSAYFIARKN
ncbi:methyltransferase domain protein [Lyngbya aestuarii BL J]|uniref:Methyltransferase domain protein n=1 Tax=Lyngbya aestuarii BL J TaxID=1348334 RepID=U7QFT2_9CYAN|nr:class I SAM-dependent methyltransferase [Lyngbya aestuarii]ERT06768.1 methyltransferase domain protein [Lyngbya aestuarii BL J]